MTAGADPPSIELLRRENAKLKAELAEARWTAAGYRDLVTAAAHEIRTPLHALGLHLELLRRLSSREGGQALKNQIDLAKRILEGFVRRTCGLLDAARVTAGAFALNPESVVLSEAVSAVVELYAAKADFKQATIEVTLEPGLVGQWDRGGVEMILANLVSNALKYGDGAPVEINAQADGAGNAVIRVIDSGPGIDDDMRRHLFEKFSRAVPPDSTIAGYGLGLWITRQLASLHGGSITLDDGPTRGTTFVVTLPLRQDATLPARRSG
ncbi:MAG: HAMP domain-containing sensor histidine kinase [Betaproteobacteria bacterium]